MNLDQCIVDMDTLIDLLQCHMANAYGVGLAVASHQFVLRIVNAKQVGIVGHKGKRCIRCIGGLAMSLSDESNEIRPRKKVGGVASLRQRDFYTG